MAATEKKNIWLVKTGDGNAPEIVNGKIAASQGILMPNSPLYLSQSGTWKVSDTADGTGDSYHGLLVGVQNKETAWPLTAELAENTVIEVMLIDIDDTYAVYVENAGSDAAAPQALIGDQNGLVVSATAGQVGYTTLNTANANACVRVVDVAGNKDTIKRSLTETPGVAYVKFLSAVVTSTRS